MRYVGDDVDPGSCQYIGGPAWYDWQSDLVGSDSSYSVAETQDELLKISIIIDS